MIKFEFLANRARNLALVFCLILLPKLGEAKILRCWPEIGWPQISFATVLGVTGGRLVCKDMKDRIFYSETKGINLGAGFSFKGQGNPRRDEVFDEKKIGTRKDWAAIFFCSIARPKKFNSTGGKLLFLGAEAGIEGGVLAALGVGIKPLSACIQIGGGLRTWGAYLQGRTIEFSRPVRISPINVEADTVDSVE